MAPKLALVLLLLGSFSQVHADTVILQCGDGTDTQSNQLCAAVENVMLQQNPDLTISTKQTQETDGIIVVVEEFSQPEPHQIAGKLSWWSIKNGTDLRVDSPRLVHQVADGEIDASSYQRLAETLLRVSKLRPK